MIVGKKNSMKKFYGRMKKFYLSQNDNKTGDLLTQYDRNINTNSEHLCNIKINYILELPDELIMYIIDYLPIKDVLNLSNINNKISKLCNSEIIWSKIFIRDFGIGYDFVKPFASHKSLYMLVHKLHYQTDKILFNIIDESHGCNKKLETILKQFLLSDISKYGRMGIIHFLDR